MEIMERESEEAGCGYAGGMGREKRVDKQRELVKGIQKTEWGRGGKEKRI